MRQLTSLDAQFLAMENGRTHGHVCGLGIYDPSTAPGGKLTLDALRELIAQRLHLLAPFRWRLAEVPFGLDYPYWVDDPNFDLEFHIRELALPAPGDDAMLAEQVARIVSRPLDRSRPLWELYLIHGLAGGRVGLLTKFHHSAIDGASGAEIFSVLLDSSCEGREIRPPDPPDRADSAPSQISMLGRGLSALPRQPLRAVRSSVRVIPHLDTVPTIRSVPGVPTLAGLSRRALRALPRQQDGGVLEGRRLHAPRTILNGRISPHRRVAFTRLSLDEVKRIKHAYGTTVNDVVVAICAGALREWLNGQGELPEEPLLAGIPVSVRTREQVGTFGNRVSMMFVAIPTNEPDPEQRLHRSHQALLSAKERHNAVPASVLADANNMIPPALFARAARVTTIVATNHPSQAILNAVISNVPGSPTPLYIAGARQEALHPISAIMDGAALNITVMSYCGGLDFGVVLDRNVTEDAWQLIATLRRAQEELVALLPAATPARRSRPRQDRAQAAPMPR